MANTLSGRRVVDLTAPLSARIWRYPGPFPVFRTRLIASHERDGFLLHRLLLSTHMGTHTDAGVHLDPKGWRQGDLDISTYIGPASIARLAPLPPLAPIGARELAAALAHYRPGDAVVLHTGWGERFGRRGYALRHPFLTPAGAAWLVEHPVRLVAADTPGLMDPRIDLSPPFPSAESADGLLLQARIPYVVGLVNLEALSTDRIWLTALPLHIVDADGAPVRAVAWELQPYD